MPRTKFQNVVFTAIMAFFMVFGMTVYSITVQTGELTYGTLIAAITEMWIEYVIVFLIVLLFMSKLAAKIAFASWILTPISRCSLPSPFRPAWSC